MASLKLIVPKGAMTTVDGVMKLAYFDIAFILGKASAFAAGQDGELEVPRWLVPEMLSRGCRRVDGASETIDVRHELATTKDSHELSLFLNAHGEQDHCFDPNTHYHSADLRRLAAQGCSKCGRVETFEGIDPVAKREPDGTFDATKAQPPVTYKLFDSVADHLDSLHQRFHERGRGRIVVMSDDDKRKRVLEIFDALAKPAA